MAIMQDHILVVEDDAKITQVLRQALEAHGHAVRTVSSGALALRDLARERPDLVILDLKLPDINGYQVCHLLRKLYHPSAVPVLMLTGMDQPIDQLRGFAHGADAYMTKPFLLAELLETVSTLLGKVEEPGSSFPASS